MKRPFLGIIVNAHNPRTQLIACYVWVFLSISSIGTTWNKRMPKSIQTLFCRYLHLYTIIQTIEISSKLSAHFQTKFYAPRTVLPLIFYLKITRLAMIKDMIGIFGLTGSKFVLPMIIGHYSIRDMTFELQPTFQERKRDIFW